MVDPNNGSEKPSQKPNGGSNKDAAKDSSFDSPLILTKDQQVGATPDEPETLSGKDSENAAADLESTLVLDAIKPEPGAGKMAEDASKRDDVRETPKNSPHSSIPARQYGARFFLLGVVLPAATGFGAALAVSYYGIPPVPSQFEQLMEEKIAAQSAEINALRADLAGLYTEQGPVNERLSETVAVIEGLSDRLSEHDSSLERLKGLTERIATVEAFVELLEIRLLENGNRQFPEAPPPVGISDNAREITSLREELQLAISELAFIKNQVGAINLEKSQPASVNPNASGTSTKKMAINRALAAIDTGSGLDAALGDMESAGLEVPEELHGISKGGVASIAEISGDFPEAARNALTEIRKSATKSGGIDGLNAFLSNMVNIRSLAPREGSDPDAILSRAEHAVQTGRLSDALMEIEKLPAEGLSEFSIWIENLSRRLDAIAMIQSMDDSPDR
ncbi:MAG: hypothetical protein OXC72_01160 [Roseovarius sp.]|nr:hypothetical protein [Roseovarius sp.]